jgi:hypothetical protein
MNRQENGFAGQCLQRMLGKAMIAIAAFSWLAVCPDASQAQRSRVYRADFGPVAEKPQPPPAANAPMITSVPVIDGRYVDIHFRNFAADVSRIALERKLVTKYGTGTWRVVWGLDIHDHRDTFDPSVRDNQRKPGARYIYHETGGLVPGDKYLYRVRAIQPYKPSPVVLLSAVKAVTVQPLELPTDPTQPNPTPSDPTQPDPTSPDPTLPDVDTKTIYLKAKQIGPFLRPYLAISPIAGEITQIEIPEVNGKSQRVYFLKPGYKLTEYVSNPDATVMLTSGQTSTPSQISELFGAAQKKVHVKFVAFVRVSQGNRPNSVAIKISSTKTDE